MPWWNTLARLARSGTLPPAERVSQTSAQGAAYRQTGLETWAVRFRFPPVAASGPDRRGERGRTRRPRFAAAGRRDSSPPASPVTVTFSDSTSALKTKLYTDRISRPTSSGGQPTPSGTEHPDREPPPEDPGSDGHRTAPEIFSSGTGFSPPTSAATSWIRCHRAVRIPVAEEPRGQLPARRPVGHAARRQASASPISRRLTACTSTTGCFARPGSIPFQARRRRGTTSRSSTRSSPSGRTAR